jgi:hypothetical protein
MKKKHGKLKDEKGHHKQNGINSGTGASQVLFSIIVV